MISKMFKTATLASGLALAAMGSAHAVPTLSVSPQGIAGSEQAESDFIDSLNTDFAIITETFEFKGGASDGFVAAEDASDQQYSISTTVGTFSVYPGDPNDANDNGDFGSGGACDNNNFSCDAGLAIFGADTNSPFGGRFPMPVETDNEQYLESMDVKKMTFNITGGFYNSIGFYMTDPNDSGGRFDFNGNGIEFDDIFDSSLPNGQVYYITLFDEAGINNFSIITNNSDDGYGIDSVTIGRVPEPGTLALLGLGIAGLTAARRKQKA